MPWRSVRILFILWQAAWLNVVVPGHTRGAITLPDGVPHSCCSQNGMQHDQPASPTQNDRAHCAICYFAAGLSTPVYFEFHLNLLGFREVATFPRVHQPVPADCNLPYFPCGPPTV